MPCSIHTKRPLLPFLPWFLDKPSGKGGRFWKYPFRLQHECDKGFPDCDNRLFEYGPDILKYFLDQIHIDQGYRFYKYPAIYSYVEYPSPLEQHSQWKRRIYNQQLFQLPCAEDFPSRKKSRD